MYESTAQQDELRQKVHDFLRSYSKSAKLADSNPNEDEFPTYLFFALGPSFGLCPYLHPRYCSVVRIRWLEVLQKYKGTPAPHIVLDGLKQKYIIQKDLRDYEDMCRRSTKELLDEISAQTGDNVTTWKTLETKISAWLVMNTTAKKDTGVIQNSIVEILELCSAFEINFFSVYQAVNEIKFSPVLKAASKKFDLVGSNGWSTNKMQFMITELERVRLERKELGKKLDKEVFQYKKKLFELSESNYICARVGKINSTYARLDHDTKIDRLLEVSFHHTDETTDLTYNARRTPEEVDEIIQFYNANLDLDHYLFTAWNKKKGIFEEFPFHKDADTGQWKINQSYIQEFVPRKSTKSAKTALFKPYQVVIQHLLLYEVAQCTSPSFSKHHIMHSVMSRFPLSQKQEAYEYGMKMLDKLRTHT